MASQVCPVAEPLEGFVHFHQCLKLCKDVVVAAFLCEAVSFSVNLKRKNPSFDGWFYRNQKQWEKKLFFGQKPQERCREALVKMEVLEERYARGSQLLHNKLFFKIDFKFLQILLTREPTTAEDFRFLDDDFEVKTGHFIPNDELATLSQTDKPVQQNGVGSKVLSPSSRGTLTSTSYVLLPDLEGRVGKTSQKPSQGSVVAFSKNLAKIKKENQEQAFACEMFEGTLADYFEGSPEDASRKDAWKEIKQYYPEWKLPATKVPSYFGWVLCDTWNEFGSKAKNGSRGNFLSKVIDECVEEGAKWPNAFQQMRDEIRRKEREVENAEKKSS
jgi:hypothetical protein